MASLEQHLAARVALPPPTECRLLREEAGISQVVLGSEIGVTGTCVGLWEAGLRRPRGDHVIQYARALRILRDAVDDLRNGDDRAHTRSLATTPAVQGRHVEP